MKKEEKEVFFMYFNIYTVLIFQLCKTIYYNFFVVYCKCFYFSKQDNQERIRNGKKEI